MFRLKTRLIKIFAMTVAALSITALVVLPAEGQGTGQAGLLEAIAKNTYDTASYAYKIQLYTFALLKRINSWMLPDTTSETANLQQNFSTQANSVLNNYTAQNSLQKKLMQDFLGQEFILKALGVDKYANDMTYGYMIGQPFMTIPADDKTDHAYNYLKNVAGLNLTHTPPGPNWKQAEEGGADRYKAFYTTVSSIQSYSGYVLSQLYEDETSGNSLTKQQISLALQASSPDWLKAIATESLGVVLRQILLYNSQSYVLTSQLLQAQKQMLATLAMTNTLIVIGDQFMETQLKSAAGG